MKKNKIEVKKSETDIYSNKNQLLEEYILKREGAKKGSE
jgi:hypothetical protein